MKFLNRSLIIIGLAALAACFSACSGESKAARHRARADQYFQKQEYTRAEVEYMNARRLQPKDASILRQLGFVYLEQGRGRLAFAALREAKQAEPQNPDLRFRLGQILLQAGDVTNARVEARFVMEHQPTNTQALYVLVDTARTPAEIAAIRQEVEAFAARHGNSADSHVALAELSFRERNFPAVEEHLKKANALQPNAPAVNTTLAKLRLAETNVIEAEVFLKRAAEAAPLRSSYRLQWAEFKIRTGDRAAARHILGEITDKAPDYIPAWNMLSELALAEKQYDECSKIVATILKIDPSSYEAQLLRGRMFLLQDEPLKAIEEMTRLETTYQESPHLKYHLAVAHVRAGNLARANTYLDQALRVNPTYPEALVLQSELRIRAGNPGGAVPALVQVLKNQPENVPAALLLASAFQAQGRTDDALKLYRDLSARFPKNPEPLLLSGVALRQRRDYPEARAAFEQALERSPGYLAAVENLVDLEILATNYPAALQRCAAFAANSTNAAPALVLEAKVHYVKGDVAAAETALLKALEHDANSYSAYSFLAAIYVRSKDYEKALERLDGMLAQNPRSAAAWTQKGLILDNRKQRDEARKAYESAVAVNPSFAPALNNLAVIVSEDPKRLDEAHAMAARARQSAPSDPYIADTLGWLSFRRGDFVNARRLIAESAEKLDLSEVHYHLAMADYALGDEARARENFTRAVTKGDLAKELQGDAQKHLEVLNVNVAAPAPAGIALLDSAVKRNPADYLAQMRLGAAHQNQGSFDKARTAFEAASRARPQSASPLLALARLHAGRDDQRALAFARDARRIEPGNPSVALTFGSLSLRTRDFRSAAAALRDGLRAPDSSADAWYDLAVAQYALGQDAQALATLRSISGQANSGRAGERAAESLKLITDSAPGKASLAEARLKADANDLFGLVAQAEVDEAQNRAADAARRYEKAVEIAPELWLARKRLALLYVDRLNDEKAAQQHATKAREAVPGDVQLNQVLGKIALKRGEYANALRFLQEATRTAPTNGEPYYLIGVASHGLKRTNDTKVALANALKLPLSPEHKTDANRILSELK